jgi:TRAP transporter TAXI family solute receptor
VSRRTFVGVAAQFLSVCASGCRTTPARPGPAAARLRLMTYPNNHERIASPLKRALQQTLPGVGLELHRLTTENVRFVHAGRVDISFGWADRAYRAYVGDDEAAGEPYDNLRGIALLQPVPIYLIVRAGLRVDGIAALRHLRVNLGPPDSAGVYPVAQRILHAYGLQGAFQEFQLQTVPAAEWLAARQLDAMFVTVTTPSSVELAQRAGASLIPLDGAEIAQVRRQFPFVRRVPIAPGSLVRAGHTSTLGLDSLVLCRSELDDDLVYGFTRAFFIALPELAASEPSLRDVDVEQAAATTIPLHAGALRYYRQQELSR